MKTMHWLGVVATTLISLNVLTACSGDDAPAAPTGGTSSTGGTGATAGSGTTGGTGGSGTAGGPTGTQLQSPAYFVLLTGADATAGAAAPAAYSNCATCHGANGEGVTMFGPELRFVPSAYATAVVRNGRKTPNDQLSLMAAFNTMALSDADLTAIVAWSNALPKPTTGEGLYKAMCGNCHGPTTPTGGSAPISIQGVAVADVDKYVRMGNGTDVANRKEYMPAYDTTLLTDAELGMIKTFIGAK